MGSGGQGTGFRAAAAVLAKALGVTHCSLPYWLFLWFSHWFLVVVSFRLMEGLCSVWNYVFVLIGDKLSKTTV